MAKLSGDLKPEQVLNVNVGVLGHVDSGKTSLVKALSTLLSTASLDKNPQSIARGITLDLGFSAFLLPLPSRLLETSNKDNPLKGDESLNKVKEINSKEIPTTIPDDMNNKFRALQFTLVDCPGHASLIRTIIGGAQIIDMIILVVNVLKGIQTQTAECLVIGEITTKHLIIVLNKIDLLPEDDRENRIEQCKKGIRASLKSTKFANCPIVSTAAAVGGERLAAMGSAKRNTDANENTTTSSHSENNINSGVASTVPNIGLDNLLTLITDTVHLPSRQYNGPFYFSVDHCFPIKGQGTVITGTVLSGSVKVNDMIEFPSLKLERKVKSMQMFHKTVKHAKQGDRLGICLGNLDAKLVERGVAATPGNITGLHGAIALIQRIRYFKGEVSSGSKVHVTIGHSTVLATVTFFGHQELYGHRLYRPEKNDKKSISANVGGSGSGGGVSDSKKKKTDGLNDTAATTSLLAEDSWELPKLDFEWGRDFYWQDEMMKGKVAAGAKHKDALHDETSEITQNIEIGDLEGNDEGELVKNCPKMGGVQWCYLSFEQPVFTAMKSLLVASRLDTENSKSCRIAFFGRLMEKVRPSFC